MGKIIAVVSGKGGTGKTSFTANVGIALAEMGLRVLCVDCDITLRNLDLALGLSDSAMMDFCDVAKGRCALENATVSHRKYSCLHLLTAPQTADALEVSQKQMLRLADEIRQNYDFCLIDAPAGLGLGFRLATFCADSVVVVTTTDASALRDAQRTVMELSRFPAAACIWPWAACRKRCSRRCTPPLTTPSTWLACPSSASSPRTAMSPPPSTAALLCGTSISTLPALTKILPAA